MVSLSLQFSHLSQEPEHIRLRQQKFEQIPLLTKTRIKNSGLSLIYNEKKQPRMYPLHVILTLFGMITAGAGRIVAVKIYFQMEIEESRTASPLFVTLLYLVGQTLSLVVHYVYTWFKRRQKSYSNIDMADAKTSDNKAIEGDVEFGLSVKQIADDVYDDERHAASTVEESSSSSETDQFSGEDSVVIGDKDANGKEVMCEDKDANGSEKADPPKRIVAPPPKLQRQGSKTGLTEESKNAVAWIHKIPWFLKPMIPGFLNLCNSSLRFAGLVYIAASTAEILIAGMELCFSAVAARMIRKRLISNRRWVGISIVTLGILLVGFSNLIQKEKIKEEQQRFLIGNLLIFGQCIFAVLQDLSEEIFMQEANFPATLLLGMEGLFGLVFGLPTYIIFSSEDLSIANPGYDVGLVFLVLITGIFNIRATEVTSSMTRNVWKQFRIILVWVLGLLVYYAGGNGFGEPLVFPGSLFVLGGFSVILTGVYFYYSD